MYINKEGICRETGLFCFFSQKQPRYGRIRGKCVNLQL